MDNEPIEATTWEQCAQHVEAGGVVEVLGGDDVWRASGYSAPFYRHCAAAPGTGGWFRRRLLPLPAAARATTEPTGEFPVVDPRGRTEITDDFTAGTRTIRKWLDGGAVHGPSLLAELDAWLWYWGGSPPTGGASMRSGTTGEANPQPATPPAPPQVPTAATPDPPSQPQPGVPTMHLLETDIRALTASAGPPPPDDGTP